MSLPASSSPRTKQVLGQERDSHESLALLDSWQYRLSQSNIGRRRFWGWNLNSCTWSFLFSCLAWGPFLRTFKLEIWHIQRLGLTLYMSTYLAWHLQSTALSHFSCSSHYMQWTRRDSDSYFLFGTTPWYGQRILTYFRLGRVKVKYDYVQFNNYDGLIHLWYPKYLKTPRLAPHSIYSHGYLTFSLPVLGNPIRQIVSKGPLNVPLNIGIAVVACSC